MMNAFIKKFLNEDWSKVPGAPRVYLAAFGKHPAWNDHMDDIGLVTESLVEAKRCAYVQGVSSQIESGAWERLEPEKVLAGFDHVFIWTRPSEMIAGLIISSRDGKGRTLYPMIVCAHVIAHSLDWVWSEVVPRLEVAMESCRAATAQRGVVIALNHAQEALRRRSSALGRGDAPLSCPSMLGVAQWTAHFREHNETLSCVCHHLSVNAGEFAAMEGDPELELRARSWRLPGIPAASTSESLNAWSRFLGGQLNPFWPMLLIKRRPSDWVDAIIGEPTKDDFFRLRAAPTATPVISSVPYTAAEELRVLVERLGVDISDGLMPQRSFLNGKVDAEMLSAAAQRLRILRKSGPAGFFSRLLVRG